GALLATKVSANLTLILDLARQTSDSVRAISLATQQQQTGTDQLASAMAEILRVTEQSAQASRQTADANQDPSSLSTELSKVVAQAVGDSRPRQRRGGWRREDARDRGRAVGAARGLPVQEQPVQLERVHDGGRHRAAALRGRAVVARRADHPARCRVRAHDVG